MNKDVLVEDGPIYPSSDFIERRMKDMKVFKIFNPEVINRAFTEKRVVDFIPVADMKSKSDMANLKRWQNWFEYKKIPYLVETRRRDWGECLTLWRPTPEFMDDLKLEGKNVYRVEAV